MIAHLCGKLIHTQLDQALETIEHVAKRMGLLG